MSFYAGKYGKIKLNAIAMPLTTWRATPSANKIQIPHFDSATDGDGVVYMTNLAGLVDTEVELSGKYPQGFNLWAGAMKLKPSLTVPVFLGLTALIGMSVSVLILRTPIANNANDAAEFTLNGVVTGLITWPGD